jgi:photosystem II stability/assembly factor-like uncharacterized protein
MLFVNHARRLGLFGKAHFVIIATLAAGCSYRVMPGTAHQGSGLLSLRYEKEWLFFHSQEDIQPDHIFAGQGAILLQVGKPEQGFLASRDAGLSWTFSQLPDSIREVVSAGSFLYARGARNLWRSADAGATWTLALTGGAEIASVFASSEGLVYAGAAGRVYVAGDRGRGLRGLVIQGTDGAVRVRSVAAVGRTLLTSVRAPATRELFPAVRSLLEGHTSDTDAALDAKQALSFSGAMIYVSHDGGALWKKSPLGLDAWLVELAGTLYAVAADPLLEAAALARANPGLARALNQQLHDQRVDADDIRTSLPWPGRDALLKGPVPLAFRSTDGGENWTRIQEIPVAVHAEVARQQAAFPYEQWSPVQAPLLPRQPQQRRGGQQQQAPPRAPPVAPHVTDEVMLSFLDPLRLLTRQNHAPIIGFARAGDEVWAYLPTRAEWLALSAAVVAGTAAEGEIWQGIVAPPPGSPVELLRSTDGGQTFAAIPGLPTAWPTSIAVVPGAAYLTLRGQGAARIVP